MAEEEVDIDLADPEVILHFSSLTSRHTLNLQHKVIKIF